MRHFNANELLYTSISKGQMSQIKYILVTFDLDLNDDISITIDRIIMYRISNKMTRYYLNSKIKRPFICIEMARHKWVVKRKHDTYLHWSAFFVKLVHFPISISIKK